MDPVSSLVTGWALEAAKKAVDDPEGIAALIKVVREVIAGPSKTREQTKLENIQAQSAYAIRALGADEFERTTGMFFFKDWLELAAETPGGDRFSSDFCLVALTVLRRQHAKTGAIIQVIKFMTPLMKRKLIIGMRGMSIYGVDMDEFRILRALAILKNVDRGSKLQTFISNVAALCAIGLTISLLVSLVLFIIWSYHWCTEDPRPWYDNGPPASNVFWVRWLWSVLPIASFGGILLCASRWFDSIEDQKPFELTSFGEELRALLLEIPAEGYSATAMTSAT
jgi:hypothetical protein